ncbi:hypothetical protein DY000_02035709 [Brassica cretica]|uniref:Uncharacterized protein n=1 Tax=Brassica cretica TaxID=69181 RepID=A0ABQ7DRW9_BRACR|nr:hypothetical protein DY000_02035709 [Brassica cretica]
MLMSYITELINVFVCDFDLLRIHVNNEDPKSTHESVVLFRHYLNAFKSRTLKDINEVVCAELTAQKAGEFHVVIWRAKSVTVNVMIGACNQFFREPKSPSVSRETEEDPAVPLRCDQTRKSLHFDRQLRATATATVLSSRTGRTGWDLYRLSMKELKAISEFFTTIQPALAKRVKEEGAEDPDIEDY